MKKVPASQVATTAEALLSLSVGVGLSVVHELMSQRFEDLAQLLAVLLKSLFQLVQPRLKRRIVRCRAPQLIEIGQVFVDSSSR